MHSQTQLYFKKNITLVQLHVSVHTKLSSGFCSLLKKTFKTKQLLKLFALYSGEISLVLFLKILKLWHNSVAHVGRQVTEYSCHAYNIMHHKTTNNNYFHYKTHIQIRTSTIYTFYWVQVFFFFFSISLNNTP